MAKILNLFGRRWRRMEQDLDRELRYHLDRRVEDLIAEGLSEIDARRQAVLELGGVAQVREEVRETWTWRWIDDRVRDVRYAGRTLLRSPGFTVIAVLSLALGIGANTAVFSIFHALVLRSLPVSDPRRLVVFTHSGMVSSPYPLFRHFQEHSRTLEGVLAFRTASCRLSTGGVTERITTTLVSGNYFDMLGVRPIRGTAITEDDDREPGSGGPRGAVAVLTHGFWMRRFGGQRSVVGSRILINRRPFTVVGVAPPGFRGTEVGPSPDVFVPMMLQAVVLSGNEEALSQPLNNWLRIMGRLKEGTHMRQAEAELTTLWGGFNEELIGSGRASDLHHGLTIAKARRHSLLAQPIELLPGHAGISDLRKRYSTPLLVLVAVMGLVLLLACANVAHLLLSRAMARRREIAIRLGLGASRRQLVSQFLTESLLLAVAGGMFGLLLARMLRDALLAYLPPEQHLSAPLALEVLLFTVTVMFASALLFGLAPALQGTKVDVAPALKGGETAVRGSRTLFRKGLVVFQVSVSLLVLIAAALFLRSLHNLLTVDTGFARESILVASVQTGEGRFVPRLLEEVKRLPGVVAAGLADAPPLGTSTGWNIFVPGYTPKLNEPRSSPWVGFVSPGYFETMTIPLLLGRDFDVFAEQNLMIVNETFAKHYFGSANPVGRRVGLAEGVYDFEIIGVVKDSKVTGLREEPVRMVYLPYGPGPWGSQMVIHLRTATDPLALAPALRRKVREIDPHAPVFDVHTVQDELDRSLLRDRLVGTMTTVFGALALLLAAVGLYGTLSYGVLRRTREFGIRMAMGARAASIVRLVMRDAVSLLLAGILFGLVAAWLFGHLVSSMLFGIEPTDPMGTGIAITVLAAAVLAAAWIPARRASRVEPTRALRYE